eukprot:422647-Pelagomonas_calceolata.AAC.4
MSATGFAHQSCSVASFAHQSRCQQWALLINHALLQALSVKNAVASILAACSTAANLRKAKLKP